MNFWLTVLVVHMKFINSYAGEMAQKVHGKRATLINIFRMNITTVVYFIGTKKFRKKIL